MATPDPLGHLSTFRFRRRTPGSFLLVPCAKQGRSVRCQGQLEAAAAVILASCPEVTRIQEQPFQIWYAWRTVEGQGEVQLLENPPTPPRRRQKDAGSSYILPDFLVEMLDGRKHLVEVKAWDRLARSIVQRKLSVGRLFASKQGSAFHVLTEKDLLQGPLLSNLRLLNRYRQARLDANVLDHLVALVPADGIRIAVLLATQSPDYLSSLRTHVFHLLAAGRLSFDPRIRPLDDETLIFPGGVVSWDPFDSVWASSGSSTGGSGAWSANSPPIGSSPKISSSS